jgi:hypothetical protein
MSNMFLALEVKPERPSLRIENGSSMGKNGHQHEQ